MELIKVSNKRLINADAITRQIDAVDNNGKPVVKLQFATDKATLSGQEREAFLRFIDGKEGR